MLPNITTKIDSAFNIAITFFLLAGSLAILFYFLQSGKFIYILVSLLIYAGSFLLRNKILKNKATKGFSEIGLIFISILFLGYLLHFLNIDHEVRNYFPDTLIVASGSVFVFAIFFFIFARIKEDGLKVFGTLGLIISVTLIKFYQDQLVIFFQSNQYLVEFFIGVPILYLGALLVGIKQE